MGERRMIKNKRDKYIGKENYNHQGYLMKIISYNTYNDIEVEFAEPYHCVIKTGTGHFLNGGVVNPYAPTICGVGIVGNKYATYIKDSKKSLKEYGIWCSMLKRCFDGKYKEKFPTYLDSTCNPIWYYYDNFYEWIHEQANYNVVKNMDYNIDKDILFKGNKIYAPEKCIIIPQRVNKLFTKCDANRGEYPIGVCRDNYSGYYASYCNDGKGQVHIGNYKDINTAFEKYKEYKEEIIKSVAEEEYLKGTITKECYNAMIKYQVEITD